VAPRRTFRVVAIERIELGALRCGVLSDHVICADQGFRNCVSGRTRYFKLRDGIFGHSARGMIYREISIRVENPICKLSIFYFRQLRQPKV